MTRDKQSVRLHLYLMTTVAALSLSVAASAEVTAAAGEPNDIVVTANKRDTNLSETPIAITVLTEEALSLSPVNDLFALTTATPGVKVSDVGERAGGNGSSIAIRGFGNNFQSRTLRVGVLVDEVPLTGLRGLTSGIFDVAQIEILKGPQSSLYGLTAEAGIIKITSRRPGNEVEGKVGFDIGSFEQRGSLSLSGPLVKDVLSVGVSGFYSNLSGFLTSAVSGKKFDKGESFGVRGQVVFTPIEGLEAHLIYAHNEINDSFGTSRIPVNPTVYNAYLAANGFTQRVGRFESALDQDGSGRVRQDQLSLRLSYDFGSTTITSITAYQDSHVSNSFDPSGDPGKFFGLFNTGQNMSRAEDFYQELRASSDKDGPFTYVFGASYFKRTEATRATVEFGVGPFNPISSANTAQIDKGIFGEVTAEVVDKLRVTGGLRYADSKSRGVNTGGAFTPAAVTNLPQARTSDEVLGKFGLDYRPAAGTLIYATVSRAWLPGGVNASITAADQFFFKPEKSWTYEVGTKLSLLDRRLNLTGAIYQTDVEDYQEFVRTTLVTSYQANADKVRIRGAELEAVGTVTDAFQLRGSVSYNKGTYRKFIDATGDNAGNRLPGLPRWQGVASADYGLNTGIYASAELVYSGNYYPTGDANNAFPLDSAYTLVNLKAGWRMDNWQLIGYVNNVGNKRYFLQKLDATGDGAIASNPLFGAPGRRREFGLRGSISF